MLRAECPSLFEEHEAQHTEPKQVHVFLGFEESGFYTSLPMVPPQTPFDDLLFNSFLLYYSGVNVLITGFNGK